MTPEERAAKLRQDIIAQLMREGRPDPPAGEALIVAAIREAVDAETEACAQIVDAYSRYHSHERWFGEPVARQIRQRVARRRRYE